MNKLGLDFGDTINQTSTDTLMPGFAEALPILKELFGNEIYIVSRVNDVAVSAPWVNEYLERNKLYDYIPRTNVYFCLKREDKGAICERLKITHFVDNRTECLHYMFTVPYKYALNPTNEQIEKFPPTRISPDWNDLIGLIQICIKPKSMPV